MMWSSGRVRMNRVLRGFHPNFPIAGVICGEVVMAGFAGCFVPGDAWDAAAIVEGDVCRGAAKGKCVESDGVLYLRGLHLYPATMGEVGLVVERLSKPLVIEGLAVRNMMIGVMVTDTCSECTVEIRQSHIVAVFNGLHVGTPLPARGDLTIRDSVVQVEPPRSVTIPADAADEGVTIGSHGIVLEALHGTLDLVNVSVEGPNGARAIWDRFGTTLSARNLTVMGFGRAIIGEWVSIELRGARIECDYDAVFAPYRLSALVADQVVIEGCGQGGGCGRRCPAAIDLSPGDEYLGGPGAPPGGRLEIRNLTLVGNSWAMSTSGYESVHIEGFLVENGDHGLSITAGSVIRTSHSAALPMSTKGSLHARDSGSLPSVSLTINCRPDAAEPAAPSPARLHS
jgi:hypothetical protein